MTISRQLCALLVIGGIAGSPALTEEGGDGAALDTPGAVVPPSVEDLARVGDSSGRPLVFPGFGPLTLVPISHVLEPVGGEVWQDKEGAKILTVGKTAAELRIVPADWKAVLSLFPAPRPGDDISVKKFMWSSVPSWMVDLTLDPAAHPETQATRQRYLVAPTGKGFVVLSFRSPAGSFEADRPAMRQAAKGIRFRFDGLIAEYFCTPTLQGTGYLRAERCIDYDWGAEGGPGTGVGPDSFSIRWTGTITPRYSEAYTFTTSSDDGIRLWINNQLLIEDWTDHPATEDSGIVELKGGKEADIRVEWYENRVHASVRLSWQSESQAREVVSNCFSAFPAGGFAPPPELGGGSVEPPSGWPSLLYGDLPGGYTMMTPAGLQWEGRRPLQSMTLGEGKGQVFVSIGRVRASPSNARSLLPTFHPNDQLTVDRVSWRYTTGGQASAQPTRGWVPPVVENFASTWSAECILDGASHPETKALYRQYYLVPLRRGMLLFSFEAPDQAAYEALSADVRRVFDSVTLTAEEQEEDRQVSDDSIF